MSANGLRQVDRKSGHDEDKRRATRMFLHHRGLSAPLHAADCMLLMVCIRGLEGFTEDAHDTGPEPPLPLVRTI